MGIDDILEAVITRMPAPRGKPDGPPRAMIIDSWFDNYVGVVMLVRVVDGRLAKGERIRLMATNAVYGIEQMGVFTPKSRAARRRSRPARWASSSPASRSCRRPRSATPSRWKRSCPTTPARPPSRCPASRKSSRRSSPACTRPRRASTTSCATRWKSSSSTTASLHYEPEVSQALGFGFRCGFLGLLHMEIVQERLEREFDQDLITTAPSVVYQVELNDGDGDRDREPVEDARPGPHQGDPRADRHRAPVHAAGLRRPGDDAGQPEARRAAQHGLPRPPGAC